MAGKGYGGGQGEKGVESGSMPVPAAKGRGNVPYVPYLILEGSDGNMTLKPAVEGMDMESSGWRSIGPEGEGRGYMVDKGNKTIVQALNDIAKLGYQVKHATINLPHVLPLPPSVAFQVSHHYVIILEHFEHGTRRS